MSTGNIKTLYADREQTSAVFPRTKIQAISDKNGRGLEAFLDKLPYYGEEEPEDTYTTPIDAETLGGVPAEEYASKQYVKERILEVETGGSVDLSEFATKEDLKAIDYPVDSVNGKTGVVQLSATDVGARSNTWLPTLAEIGAAPASLANYTPYGAMDHYCSDLLGVATSNMDDSRNQASVVGTEDASTLQNSPITTGAFYAYREVVLIKSPVSNGTKVIVRLTEMYPTAGRIWINAWNPDIFSWSGWKEHNSKESYAPASLEEHVDAVAINNNELRKHSFIADVQNVDLNVPDSIMNRSGYFDQSSVNIPPNTAFGVRDVYFVNPGFVIVEARCFMADSSSQIWRNTYNANAGGWLGWECLDKRAFAPADCGLGDENKNIPSVLDVSKNGWWLTNIDTPVGSWFLCNSHVVNGGNDIIVHGYLHQTSFHAVRVKKGGVWDEWEWENPPMSIGVEYRTTERWNGKPVYTKCVNCGALANKMSVVPHNITMKNPISCVAFVDGQITAPANYQEESKLVAYATYANVFIYSNGVGDAVGKTVYAILKYTKG